MSQFLTKVLDEAEQEEPEPVVEEPEEPHEEEEESQEESNVPKQETNPEDEQLIPASRNINQYEDKLDALAGDTNQGYSRRDRLHFERFNI